MAGESQDELNMEALTEVVVHHFKAEPPTIGPFESTSLSWSVTAPDRVSVYLDNQKVGRDGNRTLTPSFSETHRLTARAGRFSRSLGVVTIHVNTRQCVTISDGQLPKILAAKITDEINADDTGLSFRVIPVPTSFGTTYQQSRPVVRITQDRITITLRLRQEVDNFPNADLDLSVHFGLVVQEGEAIAGFRQLAPVNVETHASVSFPWYAYLVPGAFPGLFIAISNAEEKAHKRLRRMVADIVGPTGSPASPTKSLNNYFLAPPGMEKHHVRLELTLEGDELFSVTYCPHEEPGVFDGVVEAPTTTEAARPAKRAKAKHRRP